jgi:two-component system LytT family response regulator
MVTVPGWMWSRPAIASMRSSCGRRRGRHDAGARALERAELKAFLIDDEPLARRELRRLLAAHPDIEVVGEAGGAEDALRALPRLEPDLLFLDIHMPERDGFELLESLDEMPRVIFTTAHDAHALRAFEVGAIDYLLKPISPARLAAALVRVAERAGSSGPDHAPADRPLLLRDGDRSFLVRLEEVAWFEAAGNYVQVHFGEHRPLLLRSLDQLERRLDPALFFRASRSAIVNLGQVERFETGVRGELIARLKDGRPVPFSRRQSVAFRKRSSL